MWIEARGQETLGHEERSIGELDAIGLSVAAEDALRFNSSEDLTAVFPNVIHQRFGESRRPAEAHLGKVTSGQQRRDRVAKAPEPKIDFAQSVEEEESGTYHVVLELASHKVEG